MNMKKTVLLLLLSINTFSFAQEKTYTIKDVEKIAIYPGCEENLDNIKQIKCLNNKLLSDLNSQLSDSVKRMTANNRSGYFRTINTFTINSNGDFVDIVSNGDRQLSDAVKNALKKLNKLQTKTNKKIVPAKNSNGENVSLQFSIPINVNISN